MVGVRLPYCEGEGEVEDEGEGEFKGEGEGESADEAEAIGLFEVTERGR